MGGDGVNDVSAGAGKGVGGMVNAPAALKSFDSVSSTLLLRKVTVIWPKVYIFILFHL